MQPAWNPTGGLDRTQTQPSEKATKNHKPVTINHPEKPLGDAGAPPVARTTPKGPHSAPSGDEGGVTMGQQGDGGNAGFVDRVAESATLKLLTKVVFPLLVLLTIPLIVAQWNGLIAKVEKVESGQHEHAGKIASVSQEVTTINTKLDAGLMWRLSQLERRTDAMEARMERREAQQR